jgi:tRNA pseudouridine55 synthase
MLIGKRFTKRAATFLSDDKEYLALIQLGASTDTHDCEGRIIASSDIIPTHTDVEAAIACFQGRMAQQAPMFSAKKVGGKRLYERARRNEVCERPVSQIEISTTLVRYAYPELELHIRCSKGTYIRSIGHDIGKKLGCEAYVGALKRLRSGSFRIESCIPGEWIGDPAQDLCSHLLCE